MGGFLPQGLILAAQELPDGTILSFDKSLLVNIGIMWFNVILLTVVLIKLLYKPVKQFMHKRAEGIRGELSTARDQLDEALELKKKYEQLLVELESERDEILHAAHRKAVERSDHMLFEARREAEAVREQALADLDEERANMENEIKKQIIEISTLMAGRFVEVSINREDQNRLIEQAFAEWEAG